MPSLAELPPPPPGRTGWPWTEGLETCPPAMPDGAPWPRISVVTPSYNQGQYLEETLRSVLLQGYPDLEYWVMDGGSQDSSRDLLQKYAGHLAGWVSEPDRGQADAINKGWARSSGALLAWLNSDDTYLPGALAAQAQTLASAPGCIGAYGDVLYTNSDGAPASVGYGREYSLYEFLRFAIPAQPTTVIRRQAYQTLGPLDASFRYSMDSDYWIRMAPLGSFAYTPRLIATYRLHAHSKTVGEFAGCYREWRRVLDNFYAVPEHARKYATWRPGLYADLEAQMAALEIQHGSVSAGLRLALTALRQGGLRPRLFKTPAAVVGRYLAPGLLARLVEAWSRLRGGRPDGR